MRGSAMADVSTLRLWMRRILGVAAISFFLFDGVAKLTHDTLFVDGAMRLGAPGSAIPVLGVFPLVLTIFYALPRSAPPGVVAITAFLGAAIALRLLFGDMTTELAPFPVYSAGFVCGGLLLREPRIAQLFRSEGVDPPIAPAPPIDVAVEHTVVDEVLDRSSDDVCFIDPEPTPGELDDDVPLNRIAS
jgi:hypothetical protein